MLEETARFNLWHVYGASARPHPALVCRPTAARCLQLAEAACQDGLRTLDLTGGAPELNGQFRSGGMRMRAAGPRARRVQQLQA